MKVLVTGGTGFLGGWLVSDLLEKSYDVVVLRNPGGHAGYRGDAQYFMRNLSDDCIEEFVDILDYRAVAEMIDRHRPDAIVHMAAIGDVTVAKDKPRQTYEVSSNGTLNLLEAVRTYSPRTAFLSHTTDKVYSGNPVPFREGMPLNPRHIYEAAKVSQEHLTHIYASTYGVRAVTVRCGNYFGGYDFNFNRVVPYAIKCAIERTPVDLRSNGKFTRDFVYIEDAVALNTMMIERMVGAGDGDGLFGEAYNFSLETEITVIDLVRKILGLCGQEIPVRVKGDAASEIPNMRLDCAKSRHELGWVPKYSLDDGLRKTIAFYRSYFGTDTPGDRPGARGACETHTGISV